MAFLLFINRFQTRLEQSQASKAKKSRRLIQANSEIVAKQRPDSQEVTASVLFQTALE
jgi:hypothetical protein